MQETFQAWMNINLKPFIKFLVLPEVLQQDLFTGQDLSALLTDIDNWRLSDIGLLRTITTLYYEEQTILCSLVNFERCFRVIYP